VPSADRTGGHLHPLFLYDRRGNLLAQERRLQLARRDGIKQAGTVGGALGVGLALDHVAANNVRKRPFARRRSGAPVPRHEPRPAAA
jgi:hypothetical protein